MVKKIQINNLVLLCLPVHAKKATFITFPSHAHFVEMHKNQSNKMSLGRKGEKGSHLIMGLEL